jgi:hypothetical protein
MARLRTKHLCSRSCSRQQIALFLVVAAQVAVFELEFGFGELDSVLVWVLLLWRYMLMMFVVYDVWEVTKAEPTDPLLTGALQPEGVDPDQLLFCILCDGLVSKHSHHCFRCRRCAADFDHHCKYLNVCVGGANYIQFLRLLASFMLYCLDVLILSSQLLISAWVVL